METKCCGTCKWHEKWRDGWICINNDSEFCTDWTDYDHCCEEWGNADELLRRKQMPRHPS